MSRALSMCISERINWIISRIPCQISKNIFSRVPMNPQHMLEGKHRKNLFFQGSIWQNNSVSSVCTAPHQSTVLPPQQYYTQHCTALYRATQSSQPKRAAQRVGLGWVHIHRNANRRAKPTWSWTLRETHHHCAVCTGPHHQTDIQLVSQSLWLRVSNGPPGWQVLMSLTNFGHGIWSN